MSLHKFLDKEKKILYCIFYHCRDNFSEMWTGKLKARIVIDFNEPWTKILIDHKVKSKHLKIINLPLWINNQWTCPNRISSDLFHLGVNLIKKVIPSIILPIEVRLKLKVRQFISFLILAIIWKILLHGVVSQMNWW